MCLVPGETLEVTVVRSGGTFGAVNVTWRAIDGTATANAGDFVDGLLQGVVLFEAGQSVATFNVSTVDDNVPEDLYEQFTIELLNPGGQPYLDARLVWLYKSFLVALSCIIHP